VANLEQKEAKEKIQNELWQASQNDGGKSVEQNKEDFRSNLKIWWKKYANKNPQISDEIREILDEIYEK